MKVVNVAKILLLGCSSSLVRKKLLFVGILAIILLFGGSVRRILLENMRQSLVTQQQREIGV